MLSISLYGQTTGNSNHHALGINLFSITQLEQNRIKDQYAAKFHYPSGVKYEFHRSNHILRSASDFYFKKYFIEEEGEMHYHRDEGKEMEFELRTGYAYSIGKSRLQFIIGTDLFYSFGNRKGIKGGYGDFNWVYSESSYINRTNQVGIAPNLSINYKLLEKISIELMISSSVSHYWSKDKLGNVQNSGLHYQFNPIRWLGFKYQL